MSRISGKCGCGALSFAYDAKVYSVINCHCNACRTHNGSAFSSYVITDKNGFMINGDHSKLGYFSKEGVNKHFCLNCGSPVFNFHENFPNVRLIYLGIMDNSDSLPPKSNVWCENQLHWIDRLNHLENFPRESE